MYRFILSNQPTTRCTNETSISDSSTQTIFLVSSNSKRIFCYTPDELGEIIFVEEKEHEYYSSNISEEQRNQILAENPPREKRGIRYPALKLDEIIPSYSEKIQRKLGWNNGINYGFPVVDFNQIHKSLNGTDLRKLYVQRWNTLVIDADHSEKKNFIINDGQIREVSVFKVVPIDRKKFVENGEIDYRPKDVNYNFWDSRDENISFPKVINFTLGEWEEKVLLIDEMSMYQRRYTQRKNDLEERRRKERIDDAKAYDVRIGDANQRLFNEEETERNQFVVNFNLEEKLREFPEDQRPVERDRLVEERKTGLEAITARYLEQREAMQAREQEALTAMNERKDNELKEAIKKLDDVMMEPLDTDNDYKSEYIEFKGIRISFDDVPKIFKMMTYTNEIILYMKDPDYEGIYYVGENKKSSVKIIEPPKDDFPKISSPIYTVVDERNIKHVFNENELGEYMEQLQARNNGRLPIGFVKLLNQGTSVKLYRHGDRGLVAMTIDIPPYTIINDRGEKIIISTEEEMKDFVDVNINIKKLGELYDEEVRNFEIIKAGNNYIARPLSRLATAPKDILSHIGGFLGDTGAVSEALMTRRQDVFESGEVLDFMDYWSDGQWRMENDDMSEPTPIPRDWALSRKFKMPPNVNSISLDFVGLYSDWELYQSIIFELFFTGRIYGLKLIKLNVDGETLDILNSEQSLIDMSGKEFYLCVQTDNIALPINLYMNRLCVRKKILLQIIPYRAIRTRDSVTLSLFFKTFPTFILNRDNILFSQKLTPTQTSILQKYGKLNEYANIRRREILANLVWYREEEKVDDSLEILEEIAEKDKIIQKLVEDYTQFIGDYLEIDLTDYQSEDYKYYVNRVLKRKTLQELQTSLNEFELNILHDMYILETINADFATMLREDENYVEELSLSENIENMEATTRYLRYVYYRLYAAAGLPVPDNIVIRESPRMLEQLLEVFYATSGIIIPAEKTRLLEILRAIATNLRNAGENGHAADLEEEINDIADLSYHVEYYERLRRQYNGILEEVAQINPVDLDARIHALFEARELIAIEDIDVEQWAAIRRRRLDELDRMNQAELREIANNVELLEEQFADELGLVRERQREEVQRRVGRLLGNIRDEDNLPPVDEDNLPPVDEEREEPNPEEQ